MCGIAGQFFSQPDTPIQNELNMMAHIMRSRGPDDEGFFIDQHIGLVHRRLSIRDLSSAGHCPMASEDNKIQVLLNGEIYNWRELRKNLKAEGYLFQSESDTEIIVKGYQLWGEKVITKLTGMFAIAIWNNSTKQLLLARDRLGEKPLFYQLSDEGLLFASNIDAIAHTLKSKKIDSKSLACYLSHSFIPSSSTIWQGISVLKPAHMLKISPQENMVVDRYWTLPESKPIKTKLHTAEETIQKTIDNSVHLCLDADVPVGVFLSGGVDSSLIAAMAARHQPDIHAFSLGFKESDYSEVPFARKVAKHIDIPHHVVEINVHDVIDALPHLVREYGQPFGDASAIPTFLLSQYARKQVTVCLTGDGGDEIFGGYWRMQSIVYANRYANLIPKRIRQNFIPPFTNYLGKFGKRWKAMNDLSLSSPESSYTNSMSWWNILQDIAGPNLRTALPYYPTIFKAKYFHNEASLSIVQRALLNDFLVQLPDDYLTKVDVASMAASLEVRAPLLEQTVVEAAWLLPDNYKLHFGQRKWLLKKIASRLVPGDVIYRKKMGFALPLQKWFKEELGDFMDSLFSNSIADAKGWILASTVKKQLNDHRKRNGTDNKTRLWLALWLELWFRHMEKTSTDKSSRQTFNNRTPIQ